VIEIKKQELTLLKNDQVYKFMLVGFDDKETYGEIYFIENDRRTSIFRGSDAKKLIRWAKKESCYLRRK
jgi:hypothetical protein